MRDFAISFANSFAVWKVFYAERRAPSDCALELLPLVAEEFC